MCFHPLRSAHSPTACRRRTGLSHAGPVPYHAFGRRMPASEAGERTPEGSLRAQPVSAGRAHQRAASEGCGAFSHPVGPAGGCREHGHCGGTQPAAHPGLRLRSGPWAGGRTAGRRGGLFRHAGGSSGAGNGGYCGLPEEGGGNRGRLSQFTRTATLIT